jgi:hypothetical protein
MKTGKALDLIEHTGLLKGLCVHFHGAERGVTTGASAGMLFEVGRVGGAVGAQKNLALPEVVGPLDQGQAMGFALEHGRASPSRCGRTP